MPLFTDVVEPTNAPRNLLVGGDATIFCEHRNMKIASSDKVPPAELGQSPPRDLYLKTCCRDRADQKSAKYYSGQHPQGSCNARHLTAGVSPVCKSQSQVVRQSHCDGDDVVATDTMAHVPVSTNTKARSGPAQLSCSTRSPPGGSF